MTDKAVKITAHHKTCGVGEEAGTYVDSWGCELTVPGDLSRAGTIYIFKKLVGFQSTSLYREPFKLVLTNHTVEKVSCIGINSLNIETSMKDTYDFHSFYIGSRAKVYSGLLNSVGLVETKPGSGMAEKKKSNKSKSILGRVVTGASINALSASRMVKATGKLIAAKALPQTDVSAEVKDLIFVHVHACRALAAMDYDTSDPFCKITLGKLSEETRVIIQDLNPVFDEIFVFPMKGLDLEKDEIQFTMYDWDLALNDFLGYTRLPLKKCDLSANDRKKSFWLRLGLREGETTANIWKYYNPFDEDQEITGEINISVWKGCRFDKQIAVAKVPKLLDAAAAEEEFKSKSVLSYVEPRFAVVMVHILEAKDIMAMDIGGLSDPYVKVKLGDIEYNTKYINDTTTPKWNETFTFLVTTPITGKLELLVYDHDYGGFDELIGGMSCELKDLVKFEGAQGIRDAPAATWRTLVDAAGESTDSAGTAYGKLKCTAYLDMEYFEWPQENVFSKECGELIVDVMDGEDMKENAEYTVVGKLETMWCKLKKTERTKQPKWDERLVFPVHDTSSTFVLAVFNMTKSSNRLAGKVRVRVANLKGNQRYAKRVMLHKINAEGKLVTYGAINVALTFKYTNGQSMDIMGRYLEPPLPPKNFWHPLPGSHGLRMETRRKEIIAESLSQSNPPIPYDLCMEVLDGKESTFDMRVLKAHFARLNKCISYMAPLGDNFALAQSWKNPFFSTMVNCVTLMLIFNAHVIPPLILLWMLLIALRNYSKRFDVQMDFIGMDPDLSMGMSEEEVAKAKRKAEKTGEEEEEDEAGELTDSSLNPFASLQKQYNEMMEVASYIQMKLDGASTQMEQAFGMLQWLDPRCTAMICFGCFSGCAVLSTFFVLNAFRMQVGFAALAMIFLKPPGVTDPSPSPPENMIARVPTRRDKILIT